MFDGTPIQILTQASFYVSCIALGAGAFFFFIEKDKVHPRYRLALLLSTMIAGIACVMYWFMSDKYIPGKTFPTELRYIDWVITTPLMLIKFAVLLNFRDRSGIIARLVIWDFLMIVTGFLGETMGFQLGGFQTRCVMFVIGCGGWLGVLTYLYTGIRKQANLEDVETRRAIILLTKFVTFGWLIYPIGYVVRAVQPEYGDVCQFVYNVGDAINKVGFGVVVYAAGLAALNTAKTKVESEAETQPTPIAD